MQRHRTKQFASPVLPVITDHSTQTAYIIAMRMNVTVKTELERRTSFALLMMLTIVYRVILVTIRYILVAPQIQLHFANRMNAAVTVDLPE